MVIPDFERFKRRHAGGPESRRGAVTSDRKSEQERTGGPPDTPRCVRMRRNVQPRAAHRRPARGAVGLSPRWRGVDTIESVCTARVECAPDERPVRCRCRSLSIRRFPVGCRLSSDAWRSVAPISLSIRPSLTRTMALFYVM